MATTDRPHNRPGEPGHPGKPGHQGEATGRGGGGGEGGAGGRGGGDSGEPGGRGGEGGAGGAGRSYDRDDGISRWLDWTVRAVVVISVIVSSIVGAKVYSDSQCQARFNERATALTPAVNRERDTQRATDTAEAQLWLAVKPGDQSPEQRARLTALFTAYQGTLTARDTARVEADKARATHPLPTCSPSS
jgi:hypothetical protein